MLFKVLCHRFRFTRHNMTHKMWELHIKISDEVLKNNHKWLINSAKTAIKPIKHKK